MKSNPYPYQHITFEFGQSSVDSTYATSKSLQSLHCGYNLLCFAFPCIQLYFSMCYMCLHVLHFNLRSQFHEFRQIAIFQYMCALCISMSCTWICSDNCRQTTIFQRVLCAFPCVTFQFVLTIVGWQLYLSCQVARCTCWARLNLGQSSCPSIHALPNTSLTPL